MWTTIGLLITLAIAGSVIYYKVREGKKVLTPSSPPVPPTDTPSARSYSFFTEWYRKVDRKKWAKRGAILAGILLLIWFIDSKVNESEAKAKKEQAAQAKADTLWDKSVSERGFYLEDTSYVFTTTVDTNWSSVFIARRGYCLRTDALDPSKGYLYAMHHDTLKVTADHPLYKYVTRELVESMPFTLRAYGASRSTIVIWHEKVNSKGECPTKHLKLPKLSMPEVHRLSTN
ncbi:hypothetical protein KW790_00175 [Candidatus Parcubacteria bacterium]|nr:hypothetical protein [Candidatus Parcubacteria bacterium]